MHGLPQITDKIKKAHILLDRAGIFDADGLHPPLLERMAMLISIKEAYEELLIYQDNDGDYLIRGLDTTMEVETDDGPVNTLMCFDTKDEAIEYLRGIAND